MTGFGGLGLGLGLEGRAMTGLGLGGGGRAITGLGFGGGGRAMTGLGLGLRATKFSKATKRLAILESFFLKLT